MTLFKHKTIGSLWMIGENRPGTGAPRLECENYYSGLRIGMTEGGIYSMKNFINVAEI